MKEKCNTGGRPQTSDLGQCLSLTTSTQGRNSERRFLAEVQGPTPDAVVLPVELQRKLKLPWIVSGRSLSGVADELVDGGNVEPIRNVKRIGD
jgi:hypothetical protein